MHCRWLGSILMIALVGLFARAADAPKAAVPATKEISLDMVAKIKVGSSTRAEVTELLGLPWRMTNDGDCHPVNYQETWEYIGHDAAESFKINIQFDEAGIARLIAKGAAKGPVIVLAATPPPTATHQH